MRVLMVGGKNTINIINTLEPRFSSGSVEFALGEKIDDMERMLNRGDYFDRAVIIEQAWTEEGFNRQEEPVRANLRKLMEIINNRCRKESTYVFLVITEEMAKIVLEETYDIRANSRIVVKEPPYAVGLFREIATQDLDNIRTALVYDFEKLYKQEMKSQRREKTSAGDIIWSKDREIEEGAGFGDKLESIHEIPLGELKEVKEEDKVAEKAEKGAEPIGILDFDEKLFEGIQEKNPEGQGGETDAEEEDIDWEEADVGWEDDLLEKLDSMEELGSEPEELGSETEGLGSEPEEVESEPEEMKGELGEVGEEPKEVEEEPKEVGEEPEEVEEELEDWKEDLLLGTGTEDTEETEESTQDVLLGMLETGETPQGVPSGFSDHMYNKKLRKDKGNKGRAGGKDEVLEEMLNTFGMRGGSLVITGAGACGTSTLAYGITNVLVKLGYNALLVDMDTVNRTQAYISKDAYEAVHSYDTENASLKLAINNVASGLYRYVNVVSPGFHILTMGLAGSILKGSEIADKRKMLQFSNIVRNHYNFIIYDMPFDMATIHAADITYTADNIIMSVGTSNWGIMKALLAIANIDNVETQELIFKRAQLCFNKFNEVKLDSVLGTKIGSIRDILIGMDRLIIELLGMEPEFEFADMEVAGIMEYSPDIEKGWFNNVQYSDTEHGYNSVLNIIRGILLGRWEE